jgi:AraC-like DNA-binding protein
MSLLIDNLVLYEQEYKIEIGRPQDRFYYFFDYDERSYKINMEFQHFHTFYELCILLDDNAGHLINGEWYNLRCCDIVALRPSLLHRTQYPEGAPCKRLIIQFNLPKEPSQLEGSMKAIYSIFYEKCPIYRFEGKYQRLVFEKLNAIFQLSQSPNTLSDLFIHTKFLEFLGTVYTFKNKNIYSNNADFDNVTEKMYKITAYIHKHYAEDLSLEGLANEFYISGYYLSHQFKKVTGFGLTNYIQMTRVRNAQAQLVLNDTPITDIAFNCGFNSFSQFNRTFNKFAGKSPSAFRKEAAYKSEKPLLTEAAED